MILLFLFFAPAPKNKPLLQAFVTSADACPFKCVRCLSWHPDAWPRTCVEYYCDADCENEDPGGGGGGGSQPPSISHTLTCTQNGLNSWCIGALSIDLTASDPQNAVVVISGDVSGDPSTSSGQAFTCTTNPCNIPLPEGSGLVTYKADSATGLSASGSAFFYRDVTTPQISGSVNGSSGTNGWYITQTLVNASASDALSDIALFEMNVNNSGWASYGDTTFTDGIHSIQYRAYDHAGNYTETAVQEIKVDTTVPTLNVATTATAGNAGWYISNVTLTPNANDSGSGLAALEVTVNGGAWAAVTTPITLTDGIYTVQFRATDNAGNVTQTAPQEIKVDTVTPGLSLATNGTLGLNGWYKSNVSVTPNASDAGSGINKIEAAINTGVWSIVNGSSPFSDGIHTYQYKVTDNAGNATTTPILTVKVDNIAPILTAPTSLNVLDTLQYQLTDSTSGLNLFSITIAEKDNRHPATGSAWTLTGTTSNGSYRWNALFGNDAVAEVGWHPLTLQLTDMAGNTTTQIGSIEVTWKNLVYLELTGNTNQVNNTPPSNSSGVVSYTGVGSSSSVVTSNEPQSNPPSFGGTMNEIPAEQTTTTITEGGVQARLEGMSLQAGGSTFTSGNQSTNSQSTNTNILWGAAAAAMLGATLAEWQRRREEEEAARRAAMQSSSSDSDEIPADVLAKRRAKVIAKNQAKRDQEQAWENAQMAQKTQQMQNAIAKNNNLTQAEAEMDMVKPVTPYVAASYIDKDEEKWLKGQESQRAWAAVMAQERQAKPWWQRAKESVTTFVQSEREKFQIWNSIRQTYGWTPIGIFSQDELNLIAETGNDITNYVDTLSPGNGQAWVREYLSAAIIKLPIPRPMGLPGLVLLNQEWKDAYPNPKSMPLTHEMGHILDAKTGWIHPWAPQKGIVGGVADHLNTYIGGTVVEENGSRFADKSGTELKYIPADYKWTSNFNVNYGNNSTADYLCETFNALIYKQDAIPMPPRGVDVGKWVGTVIKLQADALSPDLLPSTPQAVPAPHAPSVTPTSVTSTPQPTSTTPSSSSTAETASQTPEPR